ncbi:hypothetical protein C7U60_08430 [Mesorhizobium plurifarium]|nr:hypothetical protein C7U60_08430 [Mesorhizobium plurifarium]
MILKAAGATKFPIPADWFSGELIVGVGEGSRGVLHGYGIFESYKIFVIEKGSVQFERQQKEHPLHINS